MFALLSKMSVKSSAQSCNDDSSKIFSGHYKEYVISKESVLIVNYTMPGSQEASLCHVYWDDVYPESS